MSDIPNCPRCGTQATFIEDENVWICPNEYCDKVIIKVGDV